MFDFKNQVVLITGGSRGIGAESARLFAELGADVAISFHSDKKSADAVKSDIAALGRRCLAIKADMALRSDCEHLVTATVKELGRIDCLVNNAGIAIMGPISDFRLEDFDRTFAVNVRAVFVAVQAALKHMQAGGRIINVGSCNAERVPFEGAGVYAMSKAALVGLVKGLARDLGPRGITINNVQPGPVETDMNPSTSDFAKTLVGHLAVPRYADPDEIAAMVAYLAGPESAYVTGASLSIDGGFAA